MKDARNQFLACARFARDQKIDLDRCKNAQTLPQVMDGLRFPDQPVLKSRLPRQPITQRRIFQLQPSHFMGAAQHINHQIGRTRLF